MTWIDPCGLARKRCGSGDNDEGQGGLKKDLRKALEQETRRKEVVELANRLAVLAYQEHGQPLVLIWRRAKTDPSSQSISA